MKILRPQIACPDSGSGLVPGDFSVAECLSHDREEHFLSQLTSLSIPWTRMIGANDGRDSFAKLQHSSVAEFCRQCREIVLAPNHSHDSVEGELSKAEKLPSDLLASLFRWRDTRSSSLSLVSKVCCRAARTLPRLSHTRHLVSAHRLSSLKWADSQNLSCRGLCKENLRYGPQ